MLNDAFELWLPTLQDIIVRRDDLEVGSYYQRFGFDKLVVPDDCPHVIERMDTLETLFNERYGFRMINKETLEQWQISLQTKFDRFVHVYERAYVLYQKYETEMLDDMIEGETESIVRGVIGSDSGEGSSVNTPDYVNNADDRYADSRSRSKSDSKLDETITTTKTKTGQSLIDAVNAGFKKWIDIDNAFIGEFENNFLNIFWY